MKYYIVDEVNKIVVSERFDNFGDAFDFLTTAVMPSDYPAGGRLVIFEGLE